VSLCIIKNLKTKKQIFFLKKILKKNKKKKKKHFEKKKKRKKEGWLSDPYDWSIGSRKHPQEF